MDNHWEKGDFYECEGAYSEQEFKEVIEDGK